MPLKSIASTVNSQEDTSWTSAGIPLLANRQSEDLVSLRENRAKGPWILSFNAISALCVILHLILVVLHIALLVVGVQRLEYLVVFPLERQSVISSRISGISTAFAALYSSILVLTSQTLAMRRNFQIKQTITATHDNITAWSGLGAAVCGVWNQRSIPASVFGTLSVFLYLLNISIFHISTPSLLSLQTFNFSLPTDVRTQGVPESYNSTELARYIPSLLGTMPDKMDNSNKLGLLNGTLYEVLDGSYTAPDTTVAAVGFNMTCQYLPRPNSTWDATNMRWDITFPPPFPSISLAPLAAGMIAFLYSENDTAQNFVTLMTAGLEILDSNSMTPDPVILDPPMTFPSFGESVTEVQFFRCSQTLVSQRATVNTQTGQATLLERDILKQRSSRTWSPYQDPVPAGLNASAILNMWPQWLAAGYTVNYGLSTNASDLLNLQFSSMFLIDYLNLWPAPGQQRPTKLSLNSLEDALSCLNAYIFWSIGHATPGFQVYSPDNKIITSSGSSSPVVLLEGNATVYQSIPTARLHLSIEATSAGLVAAICLTVLSLSFCRNQNDSQTMSFAGSGFLQAIWLFRSHPDLETAIPNVENPTENNLRTAGMVPVKLFDPSQMNKY
ncbi:hypothetical protein C8F04DRAFT_1271103 [Mycena alexandri]|uniref:Uncharacterized protein n=1 Tax=Mycena alexandri TaxID=1745969 RepID=A0AAD6SCJ3_9AGAR|nr:hypothetical protein C8F04DRAFT_1271103 [Mycena alexandri]